MRNPIKMFAMTCLSAVFLSAACTDIVVVEQQMPMDDVVQTDGTNGQQDTEPEPPEDSTGPSEVDDTVTDDTQVDETPTPDTTESVDDTDEPEQDTVTEPEAPQDADADGVNVDVDCDDSDASVGLAKTYYKDSDGDGYGDEEQAKAACSKPAGHASLPGDCNDSDASIHPGATEYCDGVDNDCDPSTTEANLATIEHLTLAGLDGKKMSTRTNITTQDKDNGTPTSITLGDNGPMTNVGTPTLTFCKGTHYVAIEVLSTAKIKGISNPKLDGSEMGTVIAKTGGGTLTVSDVTITNGVGSSAVHTGVTQYSNVGGGLFCHEGALVLDGVLAMSNEANRGGAIFAYECDVTIQNSSWLSNNQADYYGGAVWIANADLTIEDSTLAMNKVGEVEGKVSKGGGIFIRKGHLELDKSLMTGNKALADEDAGFGTGGAIYAYDATIKCKGGSGLNGFTTNEASSGYGSAIGLNDGSTFESVKCDFGTGITENPGKDIANFQAHCNGNYGCSKDPNFAYTGDMEGTKPTWEAVSYFEFDESETFTCEWDESVSCTEHDAYTSCFWSGILCSE